MFKKILVLLVTLIMVFGCSTSELLDNDHMSGDTELVLRKIMNDNSLVAQYLFDGNALDTSGNGNHGKVHGAELVTDRFGNGNSAYYFDGINDFISVSDSTSFDSIKEGYTISLYINTPRYNHPDIYWQGLVAKGDSPRPFSLYTQYERKIHISSTDAYRDVPGQTDAFNSSVKFSKEQWTHIAVTMEIVDDKAYVQYFIDGKSSGKKLYAHLSEIQTDDKPLLIGKTYENIREYKGIIDDIYIYNRALSSTEILALKDL